MGFFDKIKQGLSKTAASISNVFTGFSEIDDDFYDELEESLILADLGMDTTMKAMDGLRAKVKAGHLKTTEEARTALKEVLTEMLQVGDTAGKDHHHRQDCPPAPGPGQEGPALRRGHLPRRSRRPAGNLGRPRRGGDHPPGRGRGPCLGGL